MYIKKDISQIKSDITRFIGSKVWLESGKGKQKTSIKKGIIENTYPSIFTVLLCDDSDARRTISYSYTDVLTKTIEITVCE